MARLILHHPKCVAMYSLCCHGLPLISNCLALSVSSPEKAGVGGSIASLATIFKIHNLELFIILLAIHQGRRFSAAGRMPLIVAVGGACAARSGRQIALEHREDGPDK